MKKYFFGLLITWLSGIYMATGQHVTTEQRRFLEERAHMLSNELARKQRDWSALLPYVKDKRLILLGEFNHGSREVFELRNSLIQYLHRAVGANVLLFESGIGELATVDIDRARLTPEQMTYGFFGGWRTKEFVELMDFAKMNNIAVAGFDVQRTGGSFHDFLKRVARLHGLDTTTTDELEPKYGIAAARLANRKAFYDSVKEETMALILEYRKVRDQVPDLPKNDPAKALAITNLTLENRIGYLTYMLEFLKDRDWHKRWVARDSLMAKNIKWLLDNGYDDRPVIIIGHNFHIARYNEKEKVMGEFLARWYGDDMYSIGIFAGGGSYSDNSGREVEMAPPDSTALDLKHIIGELDAEVAFIDVPRDPPKGSEWLFDPIIVNDTFIDLESSNKMILSRAFDGIILLKHVSPAGRD